MNGTKKTHPLEDIYPKEFIERLQRFDRLFESATGKTFKEHSKQLYRYEIFCIHEAVHIIDIFNAKYDNDVEVIKKKILPMTTDQIFDDIVVSDEHTGHTMAASAHFAKLYFDRPEYIKYERGILSYLMGDKAYFDDRTDIEI